MNANAWFIGDLHLSEDTWKSKATHSEEEKFFIEYNDVVGKDDIAVFLGNVCRMNTAYWFNRIAELPGQKALFLGPLERNRPKWYEKFKFDFIVPFNEASITRHAMGNILISHLPAFHASGEVDKKYFGLVNKFGRLYDHNSCILNIHGHTFSSNTAQVTHRAFNVSSYKNRVISLAQIMDYKFKNA